MEESKQEKPFLNSFLAQTNIKNHSLISDVNQVSKSLDIKEIQKFLDLNEHENLKKYINETHKKDNAHTSVILYMACCAARNYINPLDTKKYKLQLEYATEGHLTENKCSIVWGIDCNTNEKVFVAKPGMMRHEHDRFLYRFFEYMQALALLPKEMKNIFINSSPAVININKIGFPQFHEKDGKDFDDYYFAYNLSDGREVEISLNDNKAKEENGLLLVGIQPVLQPCSANDFKVWIKDNPLYFVLMMGIMKLIGARDIKVNGIMLNEGIPVVIDCEDFLQQHMSFDGIPVANIHLPFIDAIKDEKIPLNTLKEASVWFKKWSAKKQNLLEFIQTEQFIFEEHHKQAAIINDDVSTDEEGQYHIDNVVGNDDDFNRKNSFNDKNQNDEENYDDGLNRWDDIDIGIVFNSDSAGTEYVKKQSENKQSEDDSAIIDAGGVHVKIYDSLKSSLDIDNVCDEYIIKINDVDKKDILTKTQQTLLIKNIDSLHQSFSQFSSQEVSESITLSGIVYYVIDLVSQAFSGCFGKSRTLLQIMHLIDQKWFKDYEAFEARDNGQCGLQADKSSAALVGLFSPKSIRKQKNSYLVDDDISLSDFSASASPLLKK